MNLNELDQYLELINSVLLKSAVKLNKWREKFMLEVLLLYLIIPGRINFLQPGRYGRFGGTSELCQLNIFHPLSYPAEPNRHEPIIHDIPIRLPQYKLLIY